MQMFVYLTMSRIEAENVCAENLYRRSLYPETHWLHFSELDAAKTYIFKMYTIHRPCVHQILDRCGSGKCHVAEIKRRATRRTCCAFFDPYHCFVFIIASSKAFPFIRSFSSFVKMFNCTSNIFVIWFFIILIPFSFFCHEEKCLKFSKLFPMFSFPPSMIGVY